MVIGFNTQMARTSVQRHPWFNALDVYYKRKRKSESVGDWCSGKGILPV